MVSAIGLPLLFCLALRAATAQKPEPEPARPLKAEVERVRVSVSVTDSHGNFVGNLQRENFRILDNGAEQPITNFAPVEAPAQALVVVETSPAVYLIHQQHLEAAYALLDGLASGDEVALATYDQLPHLILPFTQDKAALAHALLGLHYSLGMGDLRLHAALSSAVDWLAQAPGKKAIVLLSTGLDTTQPSDWDALLPKLRATEVTIYPVALGGKLREFKKDAGASATEDSGLSFERANRELESLAEVTGGQAYFPRAAADFAKFYRQIAQALRHQYSLGFTPPARDGQLHSIEVQVLDDRGRLLAPAPKRAKSRLRIFARQGYLAPAP